ncbi:GNAT family N-acetyltransferase [Tahibacter harae]|uniref:GNAT family N-acetyltransferase n=1 Tax=Tahibacter harae TaxID=2963937 RepID=A0ABT1QNZ5_9GAMM|nr:GNAT family N-acetyltransferase [Tahibacter harae]MCQ4163545.1 GNAT family N-acetyltransferase [Tahibacter harae]
MNITRNNAGDVSAQSLTAAPMSSTSPQWTHTLRNGVPVVIRPLGKADAALERAFIAALSAQSRRFRFLGQIGCPGDALIRRLTDIDYVHDVAFVALADSAGAQQEIGVARYSVSADGKSCECAVVIADAFQGQGLGTLLMNHLIAIARSRGIGEMISLDAAENFAMRDLAQALGFRREPDPEDGSQVIHRLTL